MVGQVRRVDGAEPVAQQPRLVEQLGRRRAVEHLGGEVLGRLLADVGVHDAAAGHLGHRPQVVARHGAHRVHGGADPGRRRRASRAATRVAQRVDVAVGEPPLHVVERHVPVAGQPAGEVAGVEQGEPQAGVPRRLDERLAHRVGVGVGPPAEVVVQVVELADDGDPGQHHLGEDRPSQGEVGVGREVPRDGIHLLAPRPEVAAVAVRAPAQRAVEGVAVGVGEARAGRPRAAARRRPRPGPGGARRRRRRRRPRTGRPWPAPWGARRARPSRSSSGGRHAAPPREVLEDRGQGRDALEAVGELGVLLRASARRRWGCGRRASRWGCRRSRGCRRRARRRCPGRVCRRAGSRAARSVRCRRGWTASRTPR